MRFGISLISWMLPKILRMRRCFVLAPLEVLRGASIALVAICFPALCGRARKALPLILPASRRLCGALPRNPLQCVRSVRQPGPCPGEDGKSPGRTQRCGQSRYVWIGPIYALFARAQGRWHSIPTRTAGEVHEIQGPVVDPALSRWVEGHGAWLAPRAEPAHAGLAVAAGARGPRAARRALGLGCS